MNLIKSWARRVIAFTSRSNPERLWMHYSIALLIICALLIATHSVSRKIIDQGAAAADALNLGNRQMLLAYETMMLAEEDLLGNLNTPNALIESIDHFERVHEDIMQTVFWSSELEDHYFGGPNALYPTILAHGDLLRQIDAANEADKRILLAQVKDLFGDSRLRDQLFTASKLIETASRNEAERLSNLQVQLIVGSALLLIVEILFIFLPAQMIVRANIKALRKQGDTLRRSQSELQLANGKLEYLINHDTLTGLPNRGYLMKYIRSLMPNPNAPELGILFLGLDGFKSINDTAGHDFGDNVLMQVATKLKSCIDEDNIVARVGGDEFVLVTDEPAEDLVTRIQSSFTDPLVVNGRQLPLKMTIGYQSIPQDQTEPQTVMADVGLALHFAKNSGGNRALKFQINLRKEIGSKLMLQLELSDAIQNGEIEPWFQPQIRLSDGRLHGAEVLARWRHPTRGLLTPDKFLPAAELAGLTIEMDHAIWKAAMNFARTWQNDDIWHPCISLNAAPDTIADPYLIERFLLELQASGLEADQVIVEVLETTLINGKDDMAAINIDSLAECGIALELDDFGTGYASLSKLTQLPLSGIKLDRSLIAPLPDQNADSVIRAILALAAELGLHVVAEGVEEDRQAKHLSNRGCAIGQGYGYARPMPPDEFGKWLQIHAKGAMVAGSPQSPVAKRA